MTYEAQGSHDDYRLQQSVHEHVFEKKNAGVALEILLENVFTCDKLQALDKKPEGRTTTASST